MRSARIAFTLALFTALVYAAGRVVTPESARLVTVGVMLPSLMQLIVAVSTATEPSGTRTAASAAA